MNTHLSTAPPRAETSLSPPTPHHSKPLSTRDIPFNILPLEISDAVNRAFSPPAVTDMSAQIGSGQGVYAVKCDSVPPTFGISSGGQTFYPQWTRSYPCRSETTHPSPQLAQQCRRRVFRLPFSGTRFSRMSWQFLTSERMKCGSQQGTTLARQPPTIRTRQPQDPSSSASSISMSSGDKRMCANLVTLVAAVAFACDVVTFVE